jgi:DNA-binding MarR family transcriptional regulator
MDKSLEQSVADFTHSIGIMVRRVRSAAGMDELSLAESSVLKRLEIDGPATTAELARSERVKPQSMGATIAALEKAGLVVKHPHPTDGRQMNVQLSAKGRKWRARTIHAKHAWLAQAILQLNKADQAALFKAGEIMKRLAEQ